MPKEQTVVIFTLTLLAVIGPIGPCFQSGCIRSQRIGRYRITDQVDGVASNKLVGAIYAATPIGMNRGVLIRVRVDRIFRTVVVDTTDGSTANRIW